MAIDRAELRWQCRRGLLELDYLLEAFLDRGYDTLDEAEKGRFADLLRNADPDLQAWLVHARPPPADLAGLIARIRETRP